jgi:alkylhydroperoxidase/carboxymuconolactone decarboxylase family protein YurZ
MHMHDWNKYRNQLFAAASGFGNLSPDTVNGYAAAARKPGATKQEIAEALGVAVSINTNDATREDQATA